MKEMEHEVTARRDEGGRPYLQSATKFTHGAAQGKMFVYIRRRGETLVNKEVLELEDVGVRGMLRVQGMRIIGSAEYMALDAGERMERLRMASTDLLNRERHINRLRGDEVIMRAREADFTTGYAFRWEMAGRRDDVHAPRLSLELESGTNPVAGGRPVPSSLSEKAMFFLRERLAGSIRVRPTPPSETPIMVR